MDGFVFPRWANSLRPALLVLLIGVPLYVIVMFAYGASPRTTDVGYAPKQPVPYSHALHAGELGIDCRYCHTAVEVAANATIPPTQTCMNCHANIRRGSEKLTPVRERFYDTEAAAGMPLEWIRVHDLPDYVYFNHSAHVRRGVGCVSCHGRVDKMEVVYQAEPLSMGWCLDCHRNPEPHLRPLDKITDMSWQPADSAEGHRLAEQYNIHPSTDCNTCHR
jgi:hypothetical protein